MDVPLPSYHDAVRQLDWLDLVAPYCSVKDYPQLCLVSRRFYDRFARRLWMNPLRTVRQLGLHRENDINWYFKFLNKQIPHARLETRTLVSILDFRGFAHAAADFYSDTRETSVSGTFRRFPTLFPSLRCVLLDDHPEFEPAFLVMAAAGAQPGAVADAVAKGQLAPPLLLSMASCRSELQASFFESAYMRSLIYLDLSNIPGSFKTMLVQGTLTPETLPALRVLKARGREMDDSTAINLFRMFKRQLWSIDLSHNGLTDAVIPYIVSEAFLNVPLRTSSHFAVEGNLMMPNSAGGDPYGPYEFIEESDWSSDFTHPERYLVDAPQYFQEQDRPPQDLRSLRRDGRSLIRPDDNDCIARLLTELDRNSMPPSVPDIHYLDIARAGDGLTHLYLNNNRLTADGVARLLRLSFGRLQRFECDTASLALPKSALPDFTSARAVQVSAFIEETHVLRPVISSNLQVLRLHHSLVTQTPSLDIEGMKQMASMWLAEASIQPRAAFAYPQAYLPDTNPRLVSLTLTNIPRYSSGPVIQRLLRFLKLASIQERGVQDASLHFSRRTPSVLRGLRHICLEFDPDPKEEELGGSSGDENLDPQDLLDMVAKEFSFFGELGWGSSSPPASRRASKLRQTDAKVPIRSDDAAAAVETQDDDSGRLRSPRQPPRFSETEEGETVPHTGAWNGSDFEVPVWIGPGELPLYPIANEYMTLVRDPNLRRDVRPASPQQVLAGVPAGSYVYHAAWNALLAPPPGREDDAVLRAPTRSELNEMRDVVAALKEYRARTRAAYAAAQKAAGRQTVPLGEPHFFWTGRLEVVLRDAAAYYQSSKYWR